MNMCPNHDTSRLYKLGYGHGMLDDRSYFDESAHARYTIVNCVYCLGIVNGQNQITCLEGQKSYSVLRFAVDSDDSSCPAWRNKQVIEHVHNCIPCMTALVKDERLLSDYFKRYLPGRINAWRRQAIRLYTQRFR